MTIPSIERHKLSEKNKIAKTPTTTSQYRITKTATEPKWPTHIHHTHMQYITITAVHRPVLTQR